MASKEAGEQVRTRRVFVHLSARRSPHRHEPRKVSALRPVWTALRWQGLF
jgi:hypothetical protein